MSILARFLAWLDAPRFCGVCGEAIEVERHGGFDRQTGKDRPYWTWCCPKISLDVDRYGGIRQASWYGGDSHDYGTGDPRWHRLAEPET